jgi:hypothetical protein
VFREETVNLLHLEAVHSVELFLNATPVTSMYTMLNVQVDSFDCEPVDVGRLVKAAAMAADVRPAEIIDEKKVDVVLAGFCGREVIGDEARDHEAG